MERFTTGGWDALMFQVSFKSGLPALSSENIIHPSGAVLLPPSHKHAASLSFVALAQATFLTFSPAERQTQFSLARKGKFPRETSTPIEDKLTENVAVAGIDSYWSDGQKC